MIYRIVRDAIKYLLKLLYHFDVIDRHNVPSNGRAVVCCNHISNFDPPLLGGAIKRQINYMAKDELFRIPIIGKILPHVGAFPVKRGGGDTQAIRHSLQILKGENLLGIFPEGTRSKTGKLGKAHTGAVLIANKGKAPIVPAAIIGNYRLFRKMKVAFGEPIDLTPFLNEAGKMDQESIRAATDHMMGEIQKLIDKYR